MANRRTASVRTTGDAGGRWRLWRIGLIAVAVVSMVAASTPVSAESLSAESPRPQSGPVAAQSFADGTNDVAAADDGPSRSTDRAKWLADDPDAPTEEQLRFGPDGVEPPGLDVARTRPKPVSILRDGNGRSEQLKPQPARDLGPWVRDPLDEPSEVVLKPGKQVEPFAPGHAVAFGDDGPPGRAVGKQTEGSGFDGKVVINRPGNGNGIGVEMRSLNAAATREASSAGFAFDLVFDRNPGVGNDRALMAADSPVLGEAGGWSIEFDLAAFDSLVDPSAVGFVVNIGCNPTGKCKDRLILPSVIDDEAGTITVEIPDNLVAAFASRGRGQAQSQAGDAEPETDGEASEGGVPGGGGDGARSLGAGSAFPALPASPGSVALPTQGAEDSLNVGLWVKVSGEGGDFTSTAGGSVAGWQVGLPSGHAELSYPMGLPGSVGPIPSMGLFYSSGIADGMNEDASAQASRVGVGWSEPVAVITRDTKNCGTESKIKLCPRHGRHDGFNITFNGVSAPLVRTTGDGGFTHPDFPSSLNVKAWDYVVGDKNDWRVRRVEQNSVPSGHQNGSIWTSWWEVTTGDGTLYVFGREKIFKPTKGSGPASSWERTTVHADRLLLSQQTAPLYFGSNVRNGCQDRYCADGVAWFLDQVIDPSGNQAVYYYKNTLNRFKPTDSSRVMWYDADVRLGNVHWGLRYDSSSTPPAEEGSSPYRLKIDYEGRDDKPNFYCSSGSEQTCQSAPAFYSQFRMRNVSVMVDGQYRYGWQLSHKVVEHKLFLTEIQAHFLKPGSTGFVRDDKLPPPVTFSETMLDNLVYSIGGSKFPVARVESMTNESGAKVTFDYDQSRPAGSSGCDTSSLSAVRPPCDIYAVNGDNWTWWNKYKVHKVTVDPQLGAGNTYGDPMVTTYSYPSPPDWAWARAGDESNQWTDYRGHSRIDVTDASGVTVKHSFYTGMYEDRAWWDDPTKLGESSRRSGTTAWVKGPWGDSRRNNEALAALSLGSSAWRGSRQLSWDAMFYDVAAETQNWGIDDPDYEVAHRIKSEEAYSQVQLGADVFAARSKVTTFFDVLGRPSKVIDQGQTRADGSESNEFPADDRVTVTAYPGSLPGRSAAWLVAQPEGVKTHAGQTTGGEVLSDVEFDYDGIGRVKEVSSMRDNVSSDRQRVSYAYNGRGQLTKSTSHGDNSTTADDQTSSYSYESKFGLVTGGNGPLPVAGNGNDPDEFSVSIDPVFGVPLTRTDPNGRVTTFSYDNRGRSTAVRLPGAPHDSYRFDYYQRNDGIDRVRTDVLNDGWSGSDSGRYVSSWVFSDGLGRVVQTQERHQGNDNITTVVSTRYDEAGRVQAQTRPRFVDDGRASNGWHYGQPWKLGSDGPGVAYSFFEYPDTMATPQGCDGGANVRVSLRDDSNLEWGSSMSASCGLTTRSWDADGRLSTSTVDVRGNTTETIAADGGVTKYQYNLRDQLIHVTDAVGGERRFTFANQSVFGPTKVFDPDQGTTLMSYDGHGRVRSSTDARGVRLDRSYDLAGRPTKVTHGGSRRAVLEWTYDPSGAFGQLRSATNHNVDAGGVSRGSVTTSYGYDGRGRPYSSTFEVPGLPGGSKRITQVLFESGNPLRVTYPSGTSVEYGYDRLGRPYDMEITDPNAAVSGARPAVGYTEYNADGRVKTLKRGGGTAGGNLNTYFSFYEGSSGRLYSSWTHQGGSTPVAQYFYYDYSDAGLLRRIKESTATTSVDQCFTYDQAARLTRAWTEKADGDYCSTPGSDSHGFEPYEVSYSYDQVGRITAAIGTGTVDGSYTYGSAPQHAPTTAGSNTYSYDAAGNRVSSMVDGRTVEYDYDALSRLVTTSGGVGADMLYNASGQRVRRTVNNETTWYLGSGLEIDESGTEKLSLGAVTYSDGELWAHNLDHLGTPGYTVSWASGEETYRRFTPFGTPRSNTTNNATGASDLTFTGQRDDGDLDLLYYGGRFYDPVLGQFTRPDPVTPNAFAGSAGWNRFAYVFNNPVLLNDPSGFCPPNSGCYDTFTRGQARYGGSTSKSSLRAPTQTQVTQIKRVTAPAVVSPNNSYVPQPASTSSSARPSVFQPARSVPAQDPVASGMIALSVLPVAGEIIDAADCVLGSNLACAMVGVPFGSRRAVEAGIEIAQAAKKADNLPTSAQGPGAIVDAGKYDYLFGNVSSNSHNLRRSLQNQRQLNRIGVYDNAAGRDLLASHFDEVLATDSNIVRTWTDEWGTHQIRESIFAGPDGVLKFESSWQVMSDGFRLETVIPFGGG